MKILLAIAISLLATSVQAHCYRQHHEVIQSIYTGGKITHKETRTDYRTICKRERHG